MLIAIQSARDDTITVDAQRCRVENVEKGRKSYESQPPVVKSLRSLKLEVGGTKWFAEQESSEVEKVEWRGWRRQRGAKRHANKNCMTRV